MPSVPAGTDPRDYTLLDWLTAGLAEGWNVTGYMHLMMYTRQRPDLTQDDLAAALREVLEAGLAETTDNASDLRLPARRALELIVTETYVDAWRKLGGVRRIQRCATQTRNLLLEHATYAVELDPMIALYTAFAVTAPEVSARILQPAALALVELTTACAGPHDPVAVLRTVLALDAFPGTPAQLVETVTAVLSPADTPTRQPA